jgi:hypothetical protein
MATDLLSKIADELDARLRELRPLLEEYEDLLGAAAALDAAGKQVSTGRGAREAAVATTAAPARRRGRPPGKRSSAGRSVTPSASESPPAASRPAAAPPAEPAPDKPVRASKPVSPRRSAAPKRAQRGAAAVAILAALEHGSHTVSELAVVTAMSGAIINNNLRRLQQAGTITRAKREGDGKAAYALIAKAA